MLINTNYPQVPIATSNVATDLARADNQQKPPIIPPQQLTKPHEERAFNPQNERVPAYAVKEKQQQQQSAQQQSAQQQANQQMPQQAQKAAMQTLIRPQIKSAALSRRDLHNQASGQARERSSAPAPRQINMQRLRQQSPEVIAQFKEQISSFYHQQTTPNIPQAFSTQV
ncbi:hypothetical protein [Shewanella maritima]|uniref:hypothetical protein n=1 Tax=Shewanella maritima TaxID=2520507 RepID=UPI003736E85C